MVPRRRLPPVSCRWSWARTSAARCRAPAHFCGIFAHKPSLDLVPQRGSGPPQTRAIPVRGDLAVAGPMARSAADLALELEVLAGPDELSDGIGYKLALPQPRLASRSVRLFSALATLLAVGQSGCVSITRTRKSSIFSWRGGGNASL